MRTDGQQGILLNVVAGDAAAKVARGVKGVTSVKKDMRLK